MGGKAGLPDRFPFFDRDQRELAAELLRNDQAHLFADWDPPGRNDEAKKSFIRRLQEFDRSYPGGVREYLQRARRLLADAKSGKNPLDGCSLSAPSCINLTEFGGEYRGYEKKGLAHFSEAAVVLVAGGLGERLGYPGIKLDIPVETICGTSFLKNICDVIRAAESRFSSGARIPLVLMTSEQTHEATVGTLERNERFGLRKDQILFLKQTLVPTFSDAQAHLALQGKYQLSMKPNGHGDVHHVLFASGTIPALIRQGVRHLLFVQDTNAQVWNAAFAALGAAVEQRLDYTSIAVRRVPKEAMGALVRLSRGGESQTVNVEYNQLDPEEEVPDEKGFSPYPGNVNGLVVRAETYLKVLEGTRGLVPEFVNPKYADAGRSKFKEPARLETLMQDLPKLFRSGESVGVVLFDRKWCFSPLKNRLEDARARCERNLPPECAMTSESDFFAVGRMKGRFGGMKVDDGSEKMISGVPFQKGARVILRPSFALTVDEVKEKLSGGSLGEGSTLVVDGRDVRLKNVEVTDGSALEIYAVDGSEVTVENLCVSNSGYELRVLTEKELQDAKTPEYLKIRGYCFERRDPLVYRFDKPGRYRVKEKGVVCEDSGLR